MVALGFKPGNVVFMTAVVMLYPQNIGDRDYLILNLMDLFVLRYIHMPI